MAQVERVTLGVLPRFSVPDPIVFTFLDSQGNPRDLSNFDTFYVFIEKPNGTIIDDRLGVLSSDGTDGKAKYEFEVDDFDLANEETTGTKVQMVAEREDGGVVVRRHISDIAVINVDETPASAGFSGP